MGPAKDILNLGPSKGPTIHGSRLTHFSWVNREEPLNLGPPARPISQGSNLLGPAADLWLLGPASRPTYH
jgi:hypothetical protein